VFETGNFLDPVLATFTNAWMKNIAKNIPGIYELLPSERYFRDGNYYLERTYRERILGGGYVTRRESRNFAQTEEFFQTRQAIWYNSPRYSTAKTLHTNLNSTYDKIISGEINTYVIVGYNVKTLSCLLHHPSTGYVETLDQNKLGDGTVPLISSTFNFADTDASVMPRKPYYVNGVSHADLVKKSDSTLQLVKNIINGNENSLPTGVSRAVSIENKWNGYKITAACPVDLTIKDTADRWVGTVTSDSVDATEGHEFDFYICGENNDTKIAFVDNMSNIEIEGFDTGTMDFSIEQYVNGSIAKTIFYHDVPITDKTIINTTTEISDDSSLQVDSNGDGTVDQVIKPDAIIIAQTAPTIIGDKNISLKYREEKQLKDSVVGDGLTWSSSNSKYISVDTNTGRITSQKSFIKTGTAIITAQNSEGKVEFNVKVKPNFVQWLMIIFLFGWIWM